MFLQYFIFVTALVVLSLGCTALWIGKVPAQWGGTVGRDSIFYWINTLALIGIGVANLIAFLLWK